MSLLKNKVVLITGGNGDIGRATSLKLAENGAIVVINYFENEELAQNIANEINSLKQSACLFKADVSNLSEVKSLIDFTIKEFGKIDILVNNAGQINRPSSWQEISEDIWDKALNNNLKSTFFCIKESAKFLIKSSLSSIINISSTTGTLIGAPGVIAYGAAKSGVISLTKSFAISLAPVRVNAILPGFIDTKLTNTSSHDFVMRQIEKTPLKRIGKPTEVADSILFLSSEMSSFITGQCLTIDGGHSLSLT